MYEETIKTLQQMLEKGEAALQKSRQEHQKWHAEHGHQCLIIKMNPR